LSRQRGAVSANRREPHSLDQTLGKFFLGQFRIVFESSGQGIEMRRKTAAFGFV
jgi:hypothetical protein